MTDNIERFEKCKTEILLLLHSKFPVKQDLMLEEFDEYNENKESRDMFFATIVFLRESRAISVSQQIYGGFLSARLADETYRVMNLPPENEPSDKPLHERMGEALTTQAYNVLGAYTAAILTAVTLASG